jgi:hypothetical protein
VGRAVFHEQVRPGWFILGAVLSAAVIVAGVVMLARSPLLAGDGAARPERSQGNPRSFDKKDLFHLERTRGSARTGRAADGGHPSGPAVLGASAIN